MNYTSTNTEVPVFYSTLTITQFTSLIEDVMLRLQPEKYNFPVKSSDPEELLTREEAAKECKVSVATIDNDRRDGLIVPCRIAGTVRFKRGDLQKAFSGNILNPYKVPNKGKGKRA